MRMPWRGAVLIPSQDVPRTPGRYARRDLARSPRYGALIGTTEMWRRDNELRSAFGDHWRIVHRDGTSPALVYARHVYQTLAADVTYLHRAVPGVCDERQIVRARLQDRADPRVVTDEMVVHLTPSAFSRRFTGTKKRRVRAAWDEGKANVLAAVRANIHDDVPTRILGDWNHKGRSLGRSIDGQRVRYISHGIDKIILVDSPTRKWSVLPGWRLVFDLLSDHHGLAGRMRVRVVGRRVTSA